MDAASCAAIEIPKAFYMYPNGSSLSLRSHKPTVDDVKGKEKRNTAGKGCGM